MMFRLKAAHAIHAASQYQYFLSIVWLGGRNCIFIDLKSRNRLRFTARYILKDGLEKLVMKKTRILTIGTALLLGGCGLLPSSGPYSMDVGGVTLGLTDDNAQTAQPFQYASIDITEKLASRLESQTKRIAQDYKWPGKGAPHAIGVSIGDSLSVTIYESQSGGLFIPAEAGVRPGNFVTIPSQVVEPDGIITVPFAGDIKVAGRTPNDIGAEITQKLGVRAIEPQVVVTVSERVGAEVSVVGEVNTATKFTLGLSGERVLDAVARAGGPRFPGYETRLTLQRGGAEWTAPFEDMVRNPDKNIFLRPKDTVYLYREAQSFQAYGAANINGRYDFGKRDLTLSEAIGLTGGLNDNRADPEEIYLYRLESRDLLDKVGVGYPQEMAAGDASTVPVIYKLNMRKSDGFFLAQKFPMKPNDVIYVANAESVEFVKFLNILNPTSTTKINTHEAITQ